MKRDSIDFVARYYRKDSFNPAKSLKELEISPVRRFRWLRIAACVTGIAAVGVSAMILISRSETPRADVKAEEKNKIEAGAEKVVEPEIHVIDLEDTPLAKVIETIEQTYHVAVTNRPEDRGELRLTLHFTGSADELIESINEIYDLELKVTK